MAIARRKSEFAVLEYHLYCLGGEEDGRRITKSYDIRALSDGDAIVQAKAMKQPVVCELWSRARLVATIPPYRD